MGVYYYKVLGVGHGATDDELKKAYHLGMNYHPNKNPSPQADSLLKQVSEAYAVRTPSLTCSSSIITAPATAAAELISILSALASQVLSDPQKCAVNDQYGEDSLKADASPPSTPSHGLGAHGFRFNPRSAEEIFSEIFGGTGPRAPVGGVPHGFPGFDSVTGAGEPSSGAAQRKVPPIERWLACSLEDLYKGATKKMKISRDVLDSTG
jgi:DnaJ homolog subfamily B member 4